MPLGAMRIGQGELLVGLQFIASAADLANAEIKNGRYSEARMTLASIRNIARQLLRDAGGDDDGKTRST